MKFYIYLQDFLKFYFLQIHVVDEKRQYTSWIDNDLTNNVKFINSKTGIIAAKKALNDLHYMLGQQKFPQVCHQLLSFCDLYVCVCVCVRKSMYVTKNLFSDF